MVPEASSDAGWCEADSKDTVCEASGGAGWCEADCKDVVSEASGGAVTACRSVSCVALLAALLLCVWGGSIGFGSCFVGGLTWLGLCPPFSSSSWPRCLRCVSASPPPNSVLCPGSGTLDEVASFREGKAKREKTALRRVSHRFDVCLIGSLTRLFPCSSHMR